MFCFSQRFGIIRNEKALYLYKAFTGFFVGVARFELTTSTSQMWRDTGLRYTPNFLKN